MRAVPFFSGATLSTPKFVPSKSGRKPVDSSKYTVNRVKKHELVQLESSSSYTKFRKFTNEIHNCDDHQIELLINYWKKKDAPNIMQKIISQAVEQRRVLDPKIMKIYLQTRQEHSLFVGTVKVFNEEYFTNCCNLETIRDFTQFSDESLKIPVKTVAPVLRKFNTLIHDILKKARKNYTDPSILRHHS